MKESLTPSETTTKWLINELKKEFINKALASEAILLAEKELEIQKLIAEIQSAINAYNEFVESDKQNKLFINSTHTRKIYPHKLPTYTSILEKLMSNQELCNKVFFELNNSNYFKEVYEINNLEHLFINILILVYRTAILFTHTVLKQNKAQISSTLEEMACLLYLEKKETELFHAIKHWVINWQEEGFSEKLSKLIK